MARRGSTPGDRERISSVADLAVGLIEQQHRTIYDERIEGVVIADTGLFPPAFVEPLSPRLVTVPPVHVRGNLFRLADRGDAYPGEDRVSFVFASLLDPRHPSPSGIGAEAVLVWVEDATQCKLYEDPVIAGANWYLRTPSVHLRYFGEAWMNRLLAFIRHFHMPELWYWNTASIRAMRSRPSRHGEPF